MVTRGLISLVVPTYNVEKYLPDFLASLDEQTYPVEDLDIVFVDDGSTDNSRSLIESWIERTGNAAKVITQPNAGLSAARNTGLDNCENQWVTFPDPDDILERQYFDHLAAHLEATATQKADLVATNLLLMNDTTGEVTNTHPLRDRFTVADQVVDLDRHPHRIHLSAATGVYRRQRIEDLSLRFDPRIRPNFEDAHFTGLYLAEKEKPLVSFLSSAQYHYRKREDGSSLIQTSWQKSEKYLDLPRHGYLDLLERVHTKWRYTPAWVQNLVLYDIFYYFREDERIHSGTAAIDPHHVESFHELLGQILNYIDAESIADFRVVNTHWHYRQALLIHFKDVYQRPRQLAVKSLDPDKQIAQIRYFFGGDLPEEEFRARGFRIAPIHAKTRTLSLFGKVLMRERILWLPATGTLSGSLDGHRLPVVPGSYPDPPLSLTPNRLWSSLTSSPYPTATASGSSTKQPAAAVTKPPPNAAPAKATDVPQPAKKHAAAPQGATRAATRVRKNVARLNRGIRRRARLLGQAVAPPRITRQKSTEAAAPKAPQSTSPKPAPPRFPATIAEYTAGHAKQAKGLAQEAGTRRRYENAWVFMDRDIQAHDNAEHLYRYVSQHHAEVNAWFVLARTSPDWQRLTEDGFRLVDHGSIEHVLLLLNAEHLISSQVDHYVVHPLDRRKFGRSPWRFTFLQHGVTRNDLSRWINPKPISLLTTASTTEQSGFTEDETPYTFTTKEVRLTGFARHDALLAKANAVATRDRDRLLIMPTWRRELLGEAIAGGNEREPLESFWDSDYAQHWSDLVGSDRLRKTAGDNGLRITFVPHPNMQMYLGDHTFPDHVDVCLYSDVDIQTLLARGSMMITDYSSLAFESAYIYQPVIYYQFDKEKFFAGGHAVRAGSTDYSEDGFGPVGITGEEVLDEVESLASIGFAVREPYRSRMFKTFPYRDGNCCERVFRAINEIKEPVPYSKAYRKVGLDAPQTGTEQLQARVDA